MTLGIAIWGVILSTISVVWTFVRWRQEHPRIAATVVALDSFSKEDEYRCIRLTLRNRGGKKTVVENIYFYERFNWFGDGVGGFLLRLKRVPQSTFNVGGINPTAKTPVVLDSNERWEGFVPLEVTDDDDESTLLQIERNQSLAEVLRSGRLRYKIECSHTSRHIRGLVKRENHFESE